MCRLIAATAAAPFAVADHLRPFAAIARGSREYQGHGWGCAWFEDGEWRAHHSLAPVWEDVEAGRFPPVSTARVLLAHARSAFRDEGIDDVRNNMPFVIPPLAFVFNGELRGVRIAERGRIGAEKLFRFLVRTGADGGGEALARSVGLVARRTRYVRAMNFVMGTRDRFLVCSAFNEDADYFTLHVKREAGMTVVCSRPCGAEAGWTPLAEGTVEEIPWFS